MYIQGLSLRPRELVTTERGSFSGWHVVMLEDGLTAPWLLLVESHWTGARGQRLYSYSSGHDGSLSYFVESSSEVPNSDNQLTAGTDR